VSDEKMSDAVRAMDDAAFLFEVAAYDIHRGWVLPTEYRDRVREIVRKLEAITPEGVDMIQLAVNNLPFGAPVTEEEDALALATMAAIASLVPEPVT
jgi:hypothetical protein